VTLSQTTRTRKRVEDRTPHRPLSANIPPSRTRSYETTKRADGRATVRMVACAKAEARSRSGPAAVSVLIGIEPTAAQLVLASPAGGAVQA
jgi:hypothetical protein